MTEARTGALFMPRTYASTESNKTGSWRYLRPRYEEKTAPCSTGCPAGEDIGTIEMLTAQGLFKEAWEKILIENPFPAVCGRVCYHPCEAKCNRREFDSGVAIRILERFLADTAGRYELKPSIERSPAKKQKIAVAGAGPSGLTAAFFLTVLGYKCDVFEAMPEPGGVLRWAIPGYRLPPAALKNEIARIENLGISIRTGKPVSWASIEEARGNYDAVFIGCGHPRTAMINFPGEDSAGMVDGMEFLRKVRGGGSPPCEGLSAVIGGGNTAMDVARSIVRLGGKAVILYRRRRQDMPAFEEEISMALDEGVELKELLAPVRLTPDSGGYLLTMQHMKVTGEDEKGRALIGPDGSRTLDFRIQRVFKATGAEAAEEWQNPPRKGQERLALNGCVMVRKKGDPVLVYGGDLVNEKKSVAHAVASGKAAAMALDTLFREGFDAVPARLAPSAVGPGPALSMEIYMGGERRLRNPHVVRFEEINTDYFRFEPRISQPRLLREERLHSFEEIDLRISANLAMREAERCFNCGICNRCDNCYLFCPDLAVIRKREGQERHIDYDYCKGCGLCVVECPRNAMTLEEEGP